MYSTQQLDSAPEPKDGAVTIERRATLPARLAEEWDRTVAEHPGADVTQLVGWGRLRATVGYQPRFLLAYRGGELVGGGQLLCRRIPLLGQIGYLPYGPLIFISGGRADVRAALCTALRDLAALGLRALFVQPSDGYHDVSDELLTLGFQPSVAGVAPKSSVHVDLSPSEVELHAALSKKLRRWSKRWDQRGVVVRVGDEKDLPLLTELLAQTAEHQGFAALSLDYLCRLYGELAPSGRARVFVGEIHGRGVAASLMTGCGGVWTTRVSGFDRSEDTTELRVPAAVRWTAMLWAKEHGYRWFDFSGFSEASTAKMLSREQVDPESIPGPDRFKLSFGGTVYRYPPPVELIGAPLLRHGYALSKRMPGADRVQRVLRTVLRGGYSRR